MSATNLAGHLALEEDHVLVLMVEDDAVEGVVQPVLRDVERGAVTFGADRAGRHVPAMLDLADPRVLDAIFLIGSGGLDRAVVVDRHDVAAVGRELDRKQPGERGQREQPVRAWRRENWRGSVMLTPVSG